MSNTIYSNTYKLKKGASHDEFKSVAQKLWSEYVSKQKGYISHKLLQDGDSWADATTFETLEDAKNFSQGDPGEFMALANAFYAFINMNSCVSRFFQEVL